MSWASSRSLSGRDLTTINGAPEHLCAGLPSWIDEALGEYRCEVRRTARLGDQRLDHAANGTRDDDQPIGLSQAVRAVARLARSPSHLAGARGSTAAEVSRT